MAHFPWPDAMSVGNPFIDADHRHIIAIINRLHDSMLAGRGNDVIKDMLTGLLIYSEGHFRREEEEMEAINFADQAAHRREHKRLLGELVTLRNAFDGAPRLQAATVSQRLYDWLSDHIVQYDMELAAAIEASRQPWPANVCAATLTSPAQML